MTEFKTLLECYKEAGEKFPFDVYWKDEDNFTIHARTKSGAWIAEKENRATTFDGKKDDFRLIKPEPPKKYLW